MNDDAFAFVSLWDFSEPAGSEAAFRTAYLAEKEPVVRIQIAIQMARAQGLQKRFADATRTVETALADIEALAQAAPVARLRARLEQGRLHRDQRQPSEAKRSFELSLEVARALRLDFYTVDALHMLALLETDPAVALTHHRTALTVAETSSSARAKKWLGPLYNNVGWTLCDLERYEEALSVFERDIAFRLENGSAKAARIARYSAARTRRLLGQYETALKEQSELERELSDLGETDGFVLEEVAENLLALGRGSADWFGRAHAELSEDAWLLENEPARLERIHMLASEA